MKKRKPLTQYDREIIAHHLNAGVTITAIARLINRDHTVVGREIERNKGQIHPYVAEKAHYFAERRAKRNTWSKLKRHERLRLYVKRKLREGWSPEQIAGRLKNHPPPSIGKVKVSYEAIYQHIYNAEPYLYHYLRKRHPTRRKPQSRKTRTTIPDRVPIWNRPKIVSERTETGHMETDLMFGRKTKTALSVQVERVTKWLSLTKLETHTAVENLDAIKYTVESLPEGFTKSVTFDNGTENTRHRALTDEYGVDTYFCDPYKGWQKGTVENSIGLLREYVPKRCDLGQLDQSALYLIQEKLNDRPRKTLGYQTPNEALHKHLANWQNGA